MLEFPILVFITTLLIFTAYAFIGAAKARSLKDFFHFASLRRNIVALIVANVTLGTGLAYLLTASSQNGLAMLAIPVGVVVGYFSLGAFIRVMAISISEPSENLFVALRSEFNKEKEAKRARPAQIFDLAVTTPLILAFLLVFAFEIFASSQILSGVLSSDSQSISPFVIGAAIFVATLAYCILGGVQSVFRNDVLQFIGILAFVGLLVYGGFFVSPSETVDAGEAYAPPNFKIDKQIFINSVVAFFAAVATQFYSLLNAYTASNIRDAHTTSTLMRANGVMTAIILGLIVLVGATADLNFGEGLNAVILELTSRVSASSILGAIFLGVLIFGMTSVVVSTADTLVISISYFIYVNVLGRKIEDGTRRGVATVRAIMLLLFAASFVMLAIMFKYSPDLFYLLLSIANGPIVYTPFIIAVGLTRGKTPPGSALSSLWAFTFLALFLSASFSSFLFLNSVPAIIPYLSTIHLAVASLVAFAMYRTARRDYGAAQ